MVATAISSFAGIVMVVFCIFGTATMIAILCALVTDGRTEHPHSEFVVRENDEMGDTK
ncbi:MAG: hypothetical protein HY010_05290 [Acidobacteria bacterium]|nr:hypothetical protein [Acidobacteriota bacterium]